MDDSRRRFLKWTGGLIVLGLATGELTSVATKLSGALAGGAHTSTNTQTVTTTDAPATVTVTDAQTLTQTVNSTIREIQTQTVTEMQTQTTTDVVVLTDTESETVTDTTTVTEVIPSTATVTPSTASPTSPFTIFWITDTQFLSETNPGLYQAMNNWIVEQWGPMNGKVVIHTGDVVQNGPQAVEWQNASDAMSVFLTNGIPYLWCAGNHDDYVGGDSTSGWVGNTSAAAFDPIFVSNFVNAIPYAAWVGDYHDGMNTALSFSTNGLNFLVIALEWNAQPDVLQWASSILDDPEYTDHYVILAPHAYINANGAALDFSNNIDLTDFVDGLQTLIHDHSNVFLTLNGHYATECGYNSPSPIDSHNELMFDRQDCLDNPNDSNGRGVDTVTSSIPDSEKVGGATVTILTCDPLKNLVNVSTYDANTGSWRTDQYEQYSFTLFPTGATTAVNNVARARSPHSQRRATSLVLDGLR